MGAFTLPIHQSIVATTALLSLAVAPHAQAGNGRFNAGVHDFCVSVRFNAGSAQLTNIKNNFEAGSQIVADATDDQHRFGTITVVNNSGATRSADWWIRNDRRGARAQLDGYGIRGARAEIHSEFFLGTNDLTAYTITHEHMHLSYNLEDEYLPGGLPGCAEVSDETTLDYSIMDTYHSRGTATLPGGMLSLNELCVAGNHDPNGDTPQHRLHGESCWDTLASHPTRSATAPAPMTLPVAAPPPPHTVTFVDGIGGIQVMLVVDRSGSMASNNRMYYAKESSQEFTAALEPGDWVGVASFSHTISDDMDLTVVSASGTEIASADAAVRGLMTGGNTNIGDALVQGLTELGTASAPSCDRLIVLLSDGDHNWGTPPLSVIPTLQAAGATVLAVGVGDSLSTTGHRTLRQLADDTGGRYWRAGNSDDLMRIMREVAMESIAAGVFASAPVTMTPFSLHSETAFVEADAAQAEFFLAISSANDQATLELVAPDGTVVTAANVHHMGGTFVGRLHSQRFVIPQPMPGTWTMSIQTGAISNGKASVMATAESPGTNLELRLEKGSATPTESILVEATPTHAGTPIVGAVIHGAVERPDGSQVLIQFYDDGFGHDVFASDGVYTAQWSGSTEEGIYKFDVSASVANGVTVAAEHFMGPPIPAAAVPDFDRYKTTYLVVKN
ncbi:MAG: VWA domain-containing protein [Myxococcota bacterium]